MSAPDEPMAAPPTGEEVHMPASSALPLINAAALAIAIVALTISWWVVGVALLIFLATTVRWVRDVKRDIAELPLDHSHH
jgi:hypothetical protein